MWEENYDEFIRELEVVIIDIEHMVLDTSVNKA
jgi:hypothetical protein